MNIIISYKSCIPKIFDYSSIYKIEVCNMNTINFKIPIKILFKDKQYSKVPVMSYNDINHSQR